MGEGCFLQLSWDFFDLKPGSVVCCPVTKVHRTHQDTVVTVSLCTPHTVGVGGTISRLCFSCPIFFSHGSIQSPNSVSNGRLSVNIRVTL